MKQKVKVNQILYLSLKVKLIYPQMVPGEVETVYPEMDVPSRDYIAHGEVRI